MSYKIYIDEKIEDVDVNDTSVSTDWIKIESCEEMIVFVESVTGTKTTFKTCLEISPDGVFNGGRYKDKGEDVVHQGDGFYHIYDTIPCEYVRVSCVVAEGIPSTANIYIQGFRDV